MLGPLPQQLHGLNASDFKQPFPDRMQRQGRHGHHANIVTSSEAGTRPELQTLPRFSFGS